MSNELTNLRRTLSVMAEQQIVDYIPVLYALNGCLDKNINVYILSRQNEDGNTAVYCLDDDDGSYLCVFTSITAGRRLYEEERGNGWNYMLFRYDDFIRFAANSGADGIVFDPDDTGFIASPELLRDSLEAEPLPHITLVCGDVTEMAADILLCPTDAHASGRGHVEKALAPFVGEYRDELPEDLGTGDIFGSDLDGIPALDYDVLLYQVSPDAERKELLTVCCGTALNAARDIGARSIMIPCIGTGGNGIDPDYAVRAMTQSATAWMEKNDDYPLNVYFCCHDEERRALYQAYFDSLAEE